MIPAYRTRSRFPLPANGAYNSTPTYDGSGAIIHPSVVDMGAKWNGYRWWRADTPYPSDRYEDPSIWGSNDRVHWEVPDGLTNPIDPWPGEDIGGFNSDTEMVWDQDREALVVYWRQVRPAPYSTPLWWTASSRDGVTWRHHGVRFNSGMSNTIVKDPAGGWRMLAFGTPGAVYTAPDVLGPWTQSPTPLTGWIDPNGVLPYHGDMIYHKGIWLSMWSSNVPQVFAAASTDGYAWSVTLTPVSQGYRPTLAPSTEPGYIDVWTSSASRYERHPESLWFGLLSQ